MYQALLTAVTSPGGGLIGYRILSVWVGMITLALIYALGSRLFGNLAGLSALALMSVTLLPIVLSRTVDTGVDAAAVRDGGAAGAGAFAARVRRGAR